MKKIFLFAISLFPLEALASSGQWGAALRASTSLPDYLIGAANAWESVITGVGESAEVVSYIKQVETNNLSASADFISALAYNFTALTRYETLEHISQTFSSIFGGANQERKKGFSLDADFRANVAEYSSNYNSDFNSNAASSTVQVRANLTDKFLLGLAYSISNTDTNDTINYIEGTTNSFSIFMDYLIGKRFFINMGANAGQTDWTVDGSVATIKNNSFYSSWFFAGEMNMGLKFSGKNYYIVPDVGVRYWRFYSDAYTDSAAQDFSDWWYNSLMAKMSLKMGANFTKSGVSFLPNLYMGAGYNLIDNGTNNVQVALINDETYFIPVEAIDNLLFYVGAGIDIKYGLFALGLNYDMKITEENYVSHTGRVKFSVAF